MLSESANGGRTATTIPFLFEQTAYLFNLAVDPAMNANRVCYCAAMICWLAARPIGGLHAYSVPVNFQSEIGYTDIELWLGSWRCFTLRLEVFPTKLDYRTDLLELRADLQMEVRSLVFELYGRTFQTLHRKSGQRPTDIEWLTLLRGEFEKLTRALEIISRSPLQHVEVTHVFDRSLRPARPSSEVRNYLRRNGSKCVQARKGYFRASGRSWLSPEITANEQEAHTEHRRESVCRFHDQSNSQSIGSSPKSTCWSSKPRTIRAMDQFPDRLRPQAASFSDADFPRQSAGAAIPRRTNTHVASDARLSRFFSSSLALESVLEVGGGPLELPEKDLATLYELWCFVALASILRQELGLTPRPPTWLRVTQRRVALELVQGRTSVLSLERDGEECVRVVYNREDSTPTGSCRPDNTLEIFKQGEKLPSDTSSMRNTDCRMIPITFAHIKHPVRRPMRFTGCTRIAIKSSPNKLLPLRGDLWRQRFGISVTANGCNRPSVRSCFIRMQEQTPARTAL